MRIGFGYDVHRLTAGRRLILGGIIIPHEKGLAGHSDADVLVHAIIDAMLGACALGDIGTHFPDTNALYKDVDSMMLLSKTAEILAYNNYKICNIDATVVMQQPKLAPHIDQMRQNIANCLKVDISTVSIKAKTEEKLGFTGTYRGVKAYAVCMVDNI